jgi:hypothetical protein
MAAGIVGGFCEECGKPEGDCKCDLHEGGPHRP